MEVIWLGRSAFRLQAGGVRILTDPVDLPGVAPTADVVTLSRRQWRDRVTISGPFRLLEGPGEYEIKGVPITGIATPAAEPAEGTGASGNGGGRDGRTARNMVYTMALDGVSVCHLGYLSVPPTPQQVQEIGSPDVLILPVGEPEGLPAPRAAQLASQIESKLLVPMALGGPDSRAAVEQFCRELGADPGNSEPRLTVTSSGLPAQTRVVLLAAQVLS